MRRIVLFIGLVLATLGIAIPLSAHSEVRLRAPDARQTVGGEVDHIDILYWTPIRSASIDLIGPNGAVDVGETAVSDTNLVASVEFDPLTEPGDYVVQHTELSADGDTTDALYAFSYDPQSATVLASLVDREGGGPNWLILGGALGIALVAVGVFWPGRGKDQSE